MSDFLCVRRCETTIRAAGLSEQAGNVCRYGMFKEGPSSFRVETNIHNGWWWSGPVGMWASRASGLSTCPWGGVELRASGGLHERWR